MVGHWLVDEWSFLFIMGAFRGRQDSKINDGWSSYDKAKPMVAGW